MSKTRHEQQGDMAIAAVDVDKLVRELRAITHTELQARYLEVFGTPSRSTHQQYLIKRVAWQVQANAHGGMPEDARQRAIAEADFDDLRRSPPPPRQAPTAVERALESALPSANTNGLAVGTELRRPYKGRVLTVLVRRGGFEFEGEIFPSLTAVATKVTGSHWNGLAFFGVRRNKSVGTEKGGCSA